MLKKEYKKHDYQINMYDSFAQALNDKDHVEERRRANALKLTAGGTLVMGIWSLLKIFMNVFGDMEVSADGIPHVIAAFGVAMVFIAMFVIGISLRYMVWRGACREAADGKKRNGFIVCAFLIMIYDVYTVAGFIEDMISGNTAEYDITTLVFDITSFIILLELVVSAFKLRKVRKETAAGAACADRGPETDTQGES